MFIPHYGRHDYFHKRYSKSEASVAWLSYDRIIIRLGNLMGLEKNIPWQQRVDFSIVIKVVNLDAFVFSGGICI